jgi:hypothetical protein
MSVEIVSVHLPKTAGTSFRRILDRYYGRELLNIYERHLSEPPSLAGFSAVHGHFQLAPMRTLCPGAKTVVWLRHPVERIASYHRFWTTRRPPKGNPRYASFLRSDRSIESLARIQADEVPTYLGCRLSGLDFVGIVEHFNEDIRRFERWLWRTFRRPPRVWPVLRAIAKGERWVTRENRTKGNTLIDTDRRQEIEQILSHEMEIYREGLRLRSSFRLTDSSLSDSS